MILMKGSDVRWGTSKNSEINTNNVNNYAIINRYTYVCVILTFLRCVHIRSQLIQVFGNRGDDPGVQVGTQL